MPISIRDKNGAIVTDRRTSGDWRDVSYATRHGTALATDTQPDALAALAEEHHRAYGRPWIMGKFYFEALIRWGLSRKATVVDVGCGAGRLGIWLVPWLEPHKYLGIDAHLGSLVAFAEYEDRLFELASFGPRLLLSQTFDVAAFEEEIDVFLDLYVTVHLGAQVAANAYANFHAAASPGAYLVFCHEPLLSMDEMKALGWALHASWPDRYDFDYGGGHLTFNDNWHVFIAV